MTSPSPTFQPLREEFRQLALPDGGIIAYRILRSQKPRPLLILIHGMASNMTRWSEFVETTSLSGSWDLLRLDLRGHARSPFRGKVAMEQWCGDIAAILDAEGYRAAVLAGHCFGANLAVHFAAQYPARTAGLVLIEPMPREALAGRLRKARLLGPLLAAMVPLVLLVNRLGLRRRSFPVLDLQELDRNTRLAMAAAGSADAMEKRYAVPWKDLQFLPASVYLSAFRGLHLPLPPLAAITVPVLALLSTGRFLSDPAVTISALSALPRCHMVSLDARHWIPTERPAEMRREIEAWCASLADTSR